VGQLTLINTYNDGYASGLNALSWKVLSKNLPSLARQIRDSGSLTPEESKFFSNNLSKEEWWKKSVAIYYAKNGLISAKDDDEFNANIISMTIKLNGDSKNETLKNLSEAERFLLSGGAYLQLKSLLNLYEYENIDALSGLEKKVSSIRLEMKYQEARVVKLEALRKAYPNSITIERLGYSESQKDVKPLMLQIIAAKSDVDQSGELLERLQGKVSQAQIMRDFIERTKSLHTSFNGLLDCEEMLDMQEKLRAEILDGDLNKLQALDQIRQDLNQIKGRFTQGLRAYTPPLVEKSSRPFAVMATAAVAGFFLTLALLLASNFLNRRNS